MVKRKTATLRRVREDTAEPKVPKALGGPDASPDFILSVVEDQFHELREHLHVQLVRTGQLQVELDRNHREVVGIREQLNQVLALLQQNVQTGAEPGARRDTKTKRRDSAPD
jgi:hypothetical protein